MSKTQIQNVEDLRQPLESVPHKHLLVIYTEPDFLDSNPDQILAVVAIAREVGFDATAVDVESPSGIVIADVYLHREE